MVSHRMSIGLVKTTSASLIATSLRTSHTRRTTPLYHALRRRLYKNRFKNSCAIYGTTTCSYQRLKIL